MWLALLTLFGYGLLHGLGPDHCLAIGTLAAAGGGMRKAVGVSLRFGAGHTVVLALGAILAALAGLVITARQESALEVIGGVSLLALGCWTVFTKRPLFEHHHDHPHDLGASHDGFAPHVHDARSDGALVTRRAPLGGVFSTLAGAVFGLSGIRALVLLLPAVVGRSVAVSLAGVVLFGAGVVLSMLAVGWFAQKVTVAAARIERGLRVPVGVASMLCGAWWVVEHLG
jgi:ABC-type nickel/cobalt efflux system permease component RcnA